VIHTWNIIIHRINTSISTSVPQVAKREKGISVVFVKQLLLSCCKLTCKLILLTDAHHRSTEKQGYATLQTPALGTEVVRSTAISEVLNHSIHWNSLRPVTERCKKAAKMNGIKPSSTMQLSELPAMVTMWLEQLWLTKTTSVVQCNAALLDRISPPRLNFCEIATENSAQPVRNTAYIYSSFSSKQVLPNIPIHTPALQRSLPEIPSPCSGSTFRRRL